MNKFYYKCNITKKLFKMKSNQNRNKKRNLYNLNKRLSKVNK